MTDTNPRSSRAQIGDIEFKYLFTECEHHILLLKDLVASILGIAREDISHLTIINNEIPPEFSGGKLCRLDLQLKVDGSLINIELQLGHTSDFTQRSIFYLCRMATNAGKQGDDYNTLPRVISINIIDFILFPDKEAYHTTFHMSEDSDKTILSDILRVDYLELKKVQAFEPGSEPFDRKSLWMSFFKMRTEEDMQMMYQIDDPVLRKAVEELRKTKSEDVYQATLLTIEKFERDQKIALRKAIQEAQIQAKAEGQAEGLAEGQANTTADMVAMRYANCPASVLAHIRRLTDSSVLSQIGRTLFSTSSLEEFLERVQLQGRT